MQDNLILNNDKNTIIKGILSIRRSDWSNWIDIPLVEIKLQNKYKNMTNKIIRN